MAKKKFECKCDDCEITHCRVCGAHMPYAGWSDNAICSSCQLEAKDDDNFVREAYEEKDFLDNYDLNDEAESGMGYN